MSLTPVEMVLNVPALDDGPAPYDSTGSFQVEGLADRQATWSIADPAIARVDAAGMVTALATGSTVVTLQVGTARATTSATASVQVTDRGGRAAIVLQ